MNIKTFEQNSLRQELLSNTWSLCTFPQYGKVYPLKLIRGFSYFELSKFPDCFEIEYYTNPTKLKFVLESDYLDHIQNYEIKDNLILFLGPQIPRKSLRELSETLAAKNQMK